MKRSTKTSTNPTGTIIVDAALSKWPNLPSRTLALKIFKANPNIWASEDAVRCAIRYRRGTHGPLSRATVAKADKAPVQAAPANPFNLPDSDEREFKPHIVEVSETTKILVLQDIHIPYHNIASVTAAIEDGRKNGIKKILLNGDTVDCYQLSRFEKDPRCRDMLGEVNAVKQFLDVLRLTFPDCEIIWKDGNHDERLQLHLCSKVPEIVKLGLVNWPAILGFADRNITYVTGKRPIRLGKLSVMHGHEFPNGITGPVNPARGLFLRAKAAACAGHWHQTSEHSESTINEELVTCWSFGCLCELHPAYMPLNKWNHGHAIVELEPDGNYRVENRRSKNGRLY